MTSVIIPAHNEEQVIARCLRSLLESGREWPEIVVVCNGCTDRTAEVARGFPGVRVIEIDEASKTLALNVGDSEAKGFPRFFVDADVRLPLSSLLKVSAVLDTDEARVAAPRMKLVLDRHPWSVRAFYAIWTRLPYLRFGAVGSGVYAVSAAGRARFESFPDIIADDEYVRALFSRVETEVVHSCSFEVFPPRSLVGIVRVNTRFHKGNLELRRSFPALCANLRKDYGPTLKELLVSPGLWPAAAVYALVYLISRSLARWRILTGRLDWERDEGSRLPYAGQGEGPSGGEEPL